MHIFASSRHIAAYICIILYVSSINSTFLAVVGLPVSPAPFFCHHCPSQSTGLGNPGGSGRVPGVLDCIRLS